MHLYRITYVQILKSFPSKVLFPRQQSVTRISTRSSAKSQGLSIADYRFFLRGKHITQIHKLRWEPRDILKAANNYVPRCPTFARWPSCFLIPNMPIACETDWWYYPASSMDVVKCVTRATETLSLKTKFCFNCSSSTINQDLLTVIPSAKLIYV